MPQQLFDEGIEYSDGTPATITQQAKDVATFIRWAGEQWHDTRKRWFWRVCLSRGFTIEIISKFQLLSITPILTFVLLYGKRYVWAYIKSQKFIYRRLPGREWTPNSSAPKPPKNDPPYKRFGWFTAQNGTHISAYLGRDYQVLWNSINVNFRTYWP